MTLWHNCLNCLIGIGGFGLVESRVRPAKSLLSFGHLIVLNLPGQSLASAMHSTALAEEIKRIEGSSIICIREHSSFAQLTDFFADSFICESLSEIVLVVLHLLVIVGPLCLKS